MERTRQLLLAVMLFIASSQVEGVFKCEEADKGGCSNCGTAAICSMESGTLTLTEVKCTPGTQLCVVNADIGTCEPLASGGDCKCVDTPGFKQDAFDLNYYSMCFDENTQYVVKCQEGQQFTDDQGECMEATTTPSADTLECEEIGKFYTVPGDCSKYYGCYPDESFNPVPTDVSTCESATPIFDVITSKCVIIDELTPTFACAADDSGKVADVIECNAYHTCSGETEIGPIQCCPEGERFDSSSSSCVDASKVPNDKCPVISDCIDKSTLELTCSEGLTTSSGSSSSSGSPGTASSTEESPSSESTTPSGTEECPKDGYNPYPGDCTRYYACSNGTYVIQTCPGILVFNPDVGLCDLLANVPDCQ